MKKLILSVLIVSMIATVFASCSPNDKTDGGNVSESSINSEAETSLSDESGQTSDSEVSTPDESDATSKSKYVFVPHEEYVPIKPTGPLCNGSEECIGDGKHPCQFFEAYPYNRESFYNINGKRFCVFFNI